MANVQPIRSAAGLLGAGSRSTVMEACANEGFYPGSFEDGAMAGMRAEARPTALGNGMNGGWRRTRRTCHVPETNPVWNEGRGETVCVSVCVRDSVCVCEREKECVNVRVCVYVTERACV